MDVFPSGRKAGKGEKEIFSVLSGPEEWKKTPWHGIVKE